MRRSKTLNDAQGAQRAGAGLTWVDARGYMDLAGAAALSFAAFFVLFGVRIAPVAAVVLIVLLFAGAGLLCKRGLDRVWADDDGH